MGKLTLINNIIDLYIAVIVEIRRCVCRFFLTIRVVI